MKLILTKDELKYIKLAGSFAYGINWFTNAIWFKISDKLDIYINNLSEYYSQSLAIENKPDWEREFAVDGTLLKKIIDKAKWDISFSEKKEDIVVETWWAKFTLKKLHFKDLPEKWEWKSDQWINIDQQWFIKWLEMQFAAPKKHMKFVYTGVYVGIKKEYIEFATTNEFKLASYKYKQSSEYEQDLIIPYEFVTRLRDVISSSKYSVKILTDKNKIFIYLIWDKSKILLSSLLINWTFPAFQWLFSQKREWYIVLKCDDVIDAKSNLDILALPTDFNNVYIEWNEIKFEYLSDRGNIDSVVSIENDSIIDSFTLSPDFYHVITFIKKLWINEVKINRTGRFIFFDIASDEYSFMSSAMDLWKKAI